MSFGTRAGRFDNEGNDRPAPRVTVSPICLFAVFAITNLSHGHCAGSRLRECSASSPTQETRVNQRRQQRFALGLTELPQALRFVNAEAESRYFKILGANAPHERVDACRGDRGRLVIG
jgi:hypothetical protein